MPVRTRHIHRQTGRPGDGARGRQPGRDRDRQRLSPPSSRPFRALIDFTSISVPAVRRIAITHMAVNLSAVALFALSLWLRAGDPAGGAASLAAPR